MSDCVTAEQSAKLLAGQERTHTLQLAGALGYRLNTLTTFDELISEVRKRCGAPEDVDPASWRVHEAFLTLDRDWNELSPSHQEYAWNRLVALAKRVKPKGPPA